jgi:hypothetical protein
MPADWGLAARLGGSAHGYHAIFVPSAALVSPGYDGQPAVYLYITALEVNVLNCRWEHGQMSRIYARAVYLVGERDRVLCGSVPGAAYQGLRTDPACGHTPRASAAPAWQSGVALAWSVPVRTALA